MQKSTWWQMIMAELGGNKYLQLLHEAHLKFIELCILPLDDTFCCLKVKFQVFWLALCNS
jgi:hypothetical protein